MRGIILKNEFTWLSQETTSSSILPENTAGSLGFIWKTALNGGCPQMLDYFVHQNLVVAVVASFDTVHPAGDLELKVRSICNRNQLLVPFSLLKH